MTQTDRILARLRQGPVTPTDFCLPNVCDGGLPVMRVAARVEELRRQGFRIEMERLPNRVARYRLVGEPGRASGELGETKAAGIGSSRDGRAVRERALLAPSSASSEPVTLTPAEPHNFPAGRIPPRTDGSKGMALTAEAASPANASGNRATTTSKEIPDGRHVGEGLFDASEFTERGGYRDAEAA